MTFQLPLEGIDQAQGGGIVADGEAPAAQAGGFVLQFQAADPGVVVMQQLEAAPVGPFLPFGPAGETGQQPPVGDDQQPPTIVSS